MNKPRSETTPQSEHLPSSPGLSVSPGNLIKLGEALEFSVGVEGRLSIRHAWEAEPAGLFAEAITPGKPIRWMAKRPGMYLAEFVAGGSTLRRPLAVVESDWAVCQLTVGAFTAEDFAETIHGAGLPANYYVRPVEGGRPEPFSLSDPRWERYEREFGDEIYPHVMAADVGKLNPDLAHHDANWDTMSVDEIVERLSFLQQWWERQGFQPLEQVATYTPCNLFVEACRRQGIRVIHSLIPEQNWSDGEWAINHWGMPTCPFWIAKDDFRKPVPKTSDGVVGMTMNHYHVLLPHLTKWGDFVLSPSHFTRWIRAADSGKKSVRFQQFLTDTLRGWKSLSGDPFFFVAGFEFGRTFGTANMTDYNRSGLEALIELARTEKVVFATGRDVRKYFERHLPQHPETAFRQRDNWIGCTVNGKPGQAGDSLVIERRDYKAVVRDGELLPFFYYDYRVDWEFGTQDTNAPHDYAESLRKALGVRHEDGGLRFEADRPLERTVSIAVWDCMPGESEFHTVRMPALDDGRQVVLIEIPAGWSGSQHIRLTPVPAPKCRRDDIWKMQTFGNGEALHTYVHLDAPLTKEIQVPVVLSKRAVVDSATGTLGEQGPGTLTLPFGPLSGWYRFWQCGVDDITPQDNPILAPALLSADWPAEVARHQQELNRLASPLIGPDGKVAYQVFCGALLLLGTRSRAGDSDQVVVSEGSASASEKADGVIAFGPGRSFWYHPRGLPIRLNGLTADNKWSVLLHTFDPLGLDVKYDVFAGKRKIGEWKVPTSPLVPEAFFKVEIADGDIDPQGQVHLRIATSQRQILHWWEDKGFIAAVHALWIVENPGE